MSTLNKRERLLRSTILSGVIAAGAFALPAFAQDAPPAAPAAPAAEGAASKKDKIVVTGSRIPQNPNLVSSAPVTTVDASEVSLRGTIRIEDTINQLPQAFAAQGANISNGATGTATVNLRGLGAARTLVLVDGKRLPYGSPNSVPSDLNQVPAALIDRVEVLTGGASAVYGSDALSGVVNFIMQRDFEGIRFDGQYSFYQHNNDNGTIQDLIRSRGETNPDQFKLPEENVTDGFARDLSAVIGASSDNGRGNVSAYVTYRNVDAVLQANRDYSSCAFSGGPTAAAFGCGGSGTSFPGFFITNTGNYTLDQSTGNTFIPYNSNVNAYNYGPLNYYQRPDERYTLGAFANYRINENFEIYSDLSFMDYRSVAQIAPSGSFFAISQTNCDNPLLSSQQQSLLGCTSDDIAQGNLVDVFVGRRNVEGGGRQDDLRNTSYRLVGGVRGAVNDVWDYDVWASYSNVHLHRTYLNDFSIQRIGRSTVVRNDGNGTPQCAINVDSDPLNDDPACVPWNIWSIGGVTQDALDYLQVPLIQDGNTYQQVVNASLVGDLGAYGLQSPWADNGVAFAFGLEYRQEEIEATVSDNFAAGDGAGQGGPTPPFPPASFDVSEAFAEASIPLAEGRPGFEVLNLELAYRYSDYSSGISTDTYKIGGEWGPVPDIRFRGGYSRAVRAANVVELFATQGLGLYDRDFDPCGPSMTATLAQCVNTGLDPSLYGDAILDSPAGQYNALFGGNPNLQPEEGDTYTIGFVFEPSFFKNFNLSVDYFDIEISNAVGTVSPLTTLDVCLETGDPTFCNLIQRDSLGTLWLQSSAFIEATNQNLGTLSTKGIDVVANYAFELGQFGGFNVNMVGTYLNELETLELPGVTEPFDCVGFYSGNCGTPNPEWRHKLRVSWATPLSDLELSGSWRYYDDVKLFGGGSGVNAKLDAQNYFDVAGNYNLRDNIRLRGGINNVLDREPPLSSLVGAGFGNGNTYPQVYDALGRYVFVGATVDF